MTIANSQFNTENKYYKNKNNVSKDISFNSPEYISNFRMMILNGKVKIFKFLSNNPHPNSFKMQWTHNKSSIHSSELE